MVFPVSAKRRLLLPVEPGDVSERQMLDVFGSWLSTQCCADVHVKHNSVEFDCLVGRGKYGKTLMVEGKWRRIESHVYFWPMYVASGSAVFRACAEGLEVRYVLKFGRSFRRHVPMLVVMGGVMLLADVSAGSAGFPGLISFGLMGLLYLLYQYMAGVEGFEEFVRRNARNHPFRGP